MTDKLLSPAEIDTILAAEVRGLPRNTADALTMVFDQDWNLRKQLLDPEFCGVVKVNVTTSVDVSYQVARVHLMRLMKVENEARAKPEEL